MKIIALLTLIISSLFFSANSFAFKADAFKGVYPILSPADPDKPSYLLVDTNTLEVIWSKYASGPLPNDLADIKNSPVIIAAITNTNIVFLSLESNSLVGTNFLHLSGDGSTFELARQPNGQSQLGISQNGAISTYLLDVPSPL